MNTTLWIVLGILAALAIVAIWIHNRLVALRTRSTTAGPRSTCSSGGAPT